MSGHAKGGKGWTVGSLRVERPWPGGGVPGGQSTRREPGNPPPPPSLRGRGCCRSGCFGCPWADAVRRQGGFQG